MSDLITDWPAGQPIRATQGGECVIYGDPHDRTRTVAAGERGRVDHGERVAGLDGTGRTLVRVHFFGRTEMLYVPAAWLEVLR